MNRREEKHFAFLISGLVCLVCAAALAQQAQEPSPSAASAQTYSVTPIRQPQRVETLVGRGNRIEVIDKNGKASEITAKDLPVLNRYRAAEHPVGVPAAAQETEKKNAEGAEPSKEGPGTAAPQGQGKEGGAMADSSKQAESQPPGKREKAIQGTKAAQEDAKEANETAAVKQAAKERAEAIRKSNIERLRKLEWDNAWFYDKGGKPISREELDKRIEKGEVADIGATDIYLQNWKTESEKPAEENQREGTPSVQEMQKR